MNGLNRAKLFYENHLKAVIEEKFPEYVDRIAVGLVGHGSECFGYDDGHSEDHDYVGGLCIWLDEKTEREIGFQLTRAYNAAVRDSGLSATRQSLFGSAGRGVFEIGDFYKRYTGRRGAPETLEDWLYVPGYLLAEAVNGEVFADPTGKFSEIRGRIECGMPEDVRLKKLASALFEMAQSGQYNYERCLSHGEEGAAMLALNRFVKAYLEALFLLNRRHAPYYKWVMRACRELPRLGDTESVIAELLTCACAKEDVPSKIEALCGKLLAELEKEGLVKIEGTYLEPYAYIVNEKIKDIGLRNLSVNI